MFYHTGRDPRNYLQFPNATTTPKRELPQLIIVLEGLPAIANNFQIQQQYRSLQLFTTSKGNYGNQKVSSLNAL